MCPSSGLPFLHGLAALQRFDRLQHCSGSMFAVASFDQGNLMNIKNQDVVASSQQRILRSLTVLIASSQVTPKIKIKFAMKQRYSTGPTLSPMSI